jgi:hypothetical protein
MVDLSPHGRVVRVDADGWLVPDVDPAAITGPWRALCDAVVATYEEHLGAALHSVYVRGSVARGLAMDGVSDLDSWALVHTLEPGPLVFVMPWMAPVAQALTAESEVASDVELCVSDIRRIRTEPRAAFARLLLAVQSVCLAGDDIRPTLPRCRPDRAAFGPIWHVASARAQLVDELNRGLPDEELADATVWLAKTLVRAAFDLVMEREGSWTRDLYFCVDAVDRWEPQWGTPVRRAAQLAIEPSGTRAELLELVQGELAQWLENRSRQLGPRPR